MINPSISEPSGYCTALASAWETQCSELPVENSPTPEHIRSTYVRSGHPVKIKGWMDEWEYMDGCTIDDIARTHGHLLASVYSCSNPTHRWNEPLLQYIGRLRRAERGLLCSIHLIGEAASLACDYARLEAFRDWFDVIDEPGVPVLRWLILGPALAVNPLHCDIWKTSAWSALVLGCKSWLLLPPAPLSSTVPSASKAFICSQEVGDIIFVPGGWSHEVLYHEESIAITGNFVDETNIHDVLPGLIADGLEDWAAVLSKVRDLLRGLP